MKIGVLFLFAVELVHLSSGFVHVVPRGFRHHCRRRGRHRRRIELWLSSRRRIANGSNALENEDDVECAVEDEDAGECLSSSGYYMKDPETMINEVYVAEVESLRDNFPSFEQIPDDDEDAVVEATFTSNRIQFERRRSHRGGFSPRHPDQVSTHVSNIKYNRLISDRELVLVDIIRRPAPAAGGTGTGSSLRSQSQSQSPSRSISRAFHRAGPRKYLHFDPGQVNAAICVAGGLCPGLNNVVRELTHALYYLYGSKRVYGITGGFQGFHRPEYPPVLLTNDLVSEIHHEGGVVLRSSRGGFDVDAIIKFLLDKDIQQLYIVGGDGTHRGAYAIHSACSERGLNIAVAGIPKTIDNDVDYIDRSFGFLSAVEAATNGIRSASVEAKCNVPNGIGIVKLMGRSAGYLAAFAALGSGEVDLVLVPEVPIVLEGEDGILPFLRKRVKEQGYAVVVVAEGAGEELLGSSDDVDAGGNRVLPKIGDFVRKAISDYFKEVGEKTTIKYIDPSYMVRSVSANAADSFYCMQLAQQAVHGAMAGLTGFSTGLVNRNMVYLPIPLLVATSPRSMDPYGTVWEQIIAMTGQPNTAAPPRGAGVGEEEDLEFLTLPEPMVH